jgi:hypothetical protein
MPGLSGAMLTEANGTIPPGGRFERTSRANMPLGELSFPPDAMEKVLNGLNFSALVTEAGDGA